MCTCNEKGGGGGGGDLGRLIHCDLHCITTRQMVTASELLPAKARHEVRVRGDSRSMCIPTTHV